MLTASLVSPPSVQIGGHLVLLTELYPPAIGGSAVLFHQTYKRLSGELSLITERGGARDFPGRIVPHPIGTPNWGVLRMRGWRHHFSTMQVLRRATTGTPAVVHCGRALPEGVPAFLHHQLTGTPYVCWTHGEDLATASTSRELHYITRRIYLSSAVAIANSRNTAGMLRALGVPAHQVRIIYPAVDPDRFNPRVDAEPVRRRYAPGGELVLLSVGRLQRRKGHDLAIQAIARLRRDLRVTYLIAGDGDERSRLEQLAADCGVADRVVFLGPVPDESLPSLYAGCDVFLLPNRIDEGDIEGFGIVFLEAASTARPVIAGNSGGVPEAVADGDTGVLVSGTDVDELARQIDTLARDRSLRLRLGTAGRKRVLELFSWERAAVAVSDVQQIALAGRLN